MCLQVHLTHKYIKATFKIIKILVPTKLFNWYPVTLSESQNYIKHINDPLSVNQKI